jgi:hypothetical protein
MKVQASQKWWPHLARKVSSQNKLNSWSSQPLTYGLWNLHFSKLGHWSNVKVTYEVKTFGHETQEPNMEAPPLMTLRYKMKLFPSIIYIIWKFHLNQVKGHDEQIWYCWDGLLKSYLIAIGQCYGHQVCRKALLQKIHIANIKTFWLTLICDIKGISKFNVVSP